MNNIATTDWCIKTEAEVLIENAVYTAGNKLTVQQVHSRQTKK